MTGRLATLAILSALLVACSPAASGTPPAASTLAPAPTLAAVCKAGPGESWVEVDAEANLFGAGLEPPDNPPAPGGGGGGVLPPVVELPGGGERVATFPCTGGRTNCCEGTPNTGPDGDGTQSTLVDSFGGISGLIMERRAMFLAGVFITDEAPASPAPDKLDFSELAGYERIEPELGQTFFIGSGKGHSVVVPEGATRLYLGFVDAYFFDGQPGWYGNNRGALEATVAIATD